MNFFFLPLPIPFSRFFNATVDPFDPYHVTRGINFLFSFFLSFFIFFFYSGKNLCVDCWKIKGLRW